MTRLDHQEGMTLVEVLVAMVITLIVFSAALTALEAFQRQDQTDVQRNQIQDAARTTLDRMSLQLRNVAAESPTSAGALERSGPDDVVFQTVYASASFGGSNLTNQMRIRYCLDTSNPIDGITPSSSDALLVMQTQTWTSATGPSVPNDGGLCPGSTASGWNNDPNHPNQIVATNVTNNNGGQSRPVFTYAPVGSKSPAQINFVEVDLFLNLTPSYPEKETELKSGIYLRNSFAAPIASFNINQGNDVVLDASPSSDPNGQALTYQWSIDGTAITGATAQQYTAGSIGPAPDPFVPGTSHKFTLTVTSTGGLSDTSSQTVTIA